MAKPWEADADRISDRIVDLLNQEIARPDFNPLAMIAGQMLAMLAVLGTAPKVMPLELKIVVAAIHECLQSMMSGDAKV